MQLYKISDTDFVKKNMIDNVFPNFCIYNFQADTESIILSDQSGFVLTHDEVSILICGLVNFLESYTEEDIENYNQDRQKQYQSKEYCATSKSKPKQEGYIYLVKGMSDIYKIGKTKNLKHRLAALRRLPFDIELVHSIKVKDIGKVERFLLEKFADKKHKGEWFKLNQNDVNYILNGNFPDNIMKLIINDAKEVIHG